MQTCDVFLSYQREDRARAELLAHKLKAAGLTTWFDTQLSAGKSFDEEIADKLKSARALLVCWTPGAIASEWVRGEATMAHATGKLVAAFLEPTELIPPFNLIHAENLADWSGEDDHAGWAKTLARLASLSADPGLVAWAQMMGDGDAGALRAWVATQPAGPLRSTTRFWLSETNAQPIFGKTGAPALPRTPARGTGTVLGALAAALILGVGGLLFLQKKDPEPRPVVIPPAAPVGQSAGTPPPAPAGQSAGTPPPVSAVVSGVRPPAAVPPVLIADGTVLHIPPGSLVDLETGRVSADDGPGYDFEIAISGGRYRINARGAARIQSPDFEVPPNRRQFAEIPAREFDTWSIVPDPNSTKRFQCFRTVEGHGGYLRLLKGDDKDLTTGVDFAVTFFR